VAEDTSFELTCRLLCVLSTGTSDVDNGFFVC
jgi:hypothetical protein